MQARQCVGDRPGTKVAVAVIPDQAGFVDIFTTDIEAQYGNRHEASAGKNRQQLAATDDFPAADTVAVMQYNIESFDIRVRRQKGFGFGNSRARRAWCLGVHADG